VAVFQWGWLGQSIGRQGPIDAFLPVMMVAILFGLSMDYQVFLVSRMHEEWLHTRVNSRAVQVGQAETGRVITAAGTIMILVFLSFVLGGLRIIAEFGVGLAVSVLLDAFVVRSVLVPAAMALIGEANWWLPRSVDTWLPRLSIEVAEPQSATGTDRPVGSPR
jgi:putative drug exporter of the RND superfamily